MDSEILAIKKKFDIVGNSPLLERAIDIARQVAPTDLTVLITGESGTGKEFFPKIIHSLSSRKHGPYIAVNCGAIPEGTIDSELFGHEKGSFTGAIDSRKGYFEVVNGGTIFLDEVAELPLSTQVRLLRVLETGEFIRVGSSKVLKTDVRVVAATNVNIPEAIAKGRFREDLYYRLNTVPIYVPPLRQRKEDIILLFRKFASDFAQKYRCPPKQLTDDAKELLMSYRWSGNVRQLKNITEQISIIEKETIITKEILLKYLPENEMTTLPVLYRDYKESNAISERDILYKILFDMKDDINELKRLLAIIIEKTGITDKIGVNDLKFVKDFESLNKEKLYTPTNTPIVISSHNHNEEENEVLETQEAEDFEESLSLQEKEIDFIKKALQKHKGKRKSAAKELGISERTLYRKIKAYKIED